MPGEKNPFTDPEMKGFFMSLSPVIQESIEQSGVKFESIGQLRSFVKNLDKSTGDSSLC